jgi:hypothetical protein
MASVPFDNDASQSAPLFISDTEFQPHSPKVEQDRLPSHVPGPQGDFKAALSIRPANFRFHGYIPSLKTKMMSRHAFGHAKSRSAEAATGCSQG